MLGSSPARAWDPFSAIASAASSVVNTVSNVTKTVTSAVSTTINSVSSAVTTVAKSATDIVKTTVNAVTNTITAAGSVVSSTLQTVGAVITGQAPPQALLGSLGNSVSTLANNVVDTLNAAGSIVLTAASTAVNLTGVVIDWATSMLGSLFPDPPLPDISIDPRELRPTPTTNVYDLRSNGHWLVDGQNRVILSHGLNVVWKKAPYYAPNSAEGFTTADADWLRDHGFNTVRLGVLFAGVMPNRGQIDYGYLRNIDRIVQLLASRKIWVLLDFHQDQYNEKFKGEGFPDWAVYDDGWPALFTPSFPMGYLIPRLQHTYDNLYGNSRGVLGGLWKESSGLWENYQAAWSAVAQKWKNQPYLMGYEIINEPPPGSKFLPCFMMNGCSGFDERLQRFQEFMQKGIRMVDGNGIVWMEPNILSGSGGVKSYLGSERPFLRSSNMGFSWHNYCGKNGQGILVMLAQNSPPSCDSQERTIFNNAQAVVDRINTPSLMTEFGADDDFPDIKQVADMADSRLTGWQYWAYKKFNDPTTQSTDQGIFMSDWNLGSVKTGKLRVLERAYPQATSGIPKSLYFNTDTAALSYRYIPRNQPGVASGAISLRTEIYMPALHYPRGYSLNISGARVISAPNARLLMIENLPGAAEVNVEARRL